MLSFCFSSRTEGLCSTSPPFFHIFNPFECFLRTTSHLRKANHQISDAFHSVLLDGPEDLKQNQENHQKLMLDGNVAVDSKPHLKVTFAVVVALARPRSNSSRRNERASALI